MNGGSWNVLEAQSHIWNNMFKFMDSLCLKCAVQLHIPDIIHNHGEPMSLCNLATALNIQPSKSQCLSRLMRVLVRSGFFEETHSKEKQIVTYILTPVSRLLLQNEPLGVAPFLNLIMDQALMTPWEFLSRWFHSDQNSAFETAHGRSFWEYIANEDVFKNLFHDAMLSDSKLVGSVVIRECGRVFEGLESLVDVGGGSGTMAIAIADAFPLISCTVYDLPHVVESLKGTKNLRFEGGDMFMEIPQANAVLLKWILHDWNDEESIKILKNCRKAIPSKGKGGKLIVIDMIIGNNGADELETAEVQQSFDMLMMVVTSGKERDLKEWDTLYKAAGFSCFKIVHEIGARSVMEVYP